MRRPTRRSTRLVDDPFRIQNSGQVIEFLRQQSSVTPPILSSSNRCQEVSTIPHARLPDASHDRIGCRVVNRDSSARIDVQPVRSRPGLSKHGSGGSTALLALQVRLGGLAAHSRGNKRLSRALLYSGELLILLPNEEECGTWRSSSGAL